eukprot:UN09725
MVQVYIMPLIHHHVVLMVPLWYNRNDKVHTYLLVVNQNHLIIDLKFVLNQYMKYKQAYGYMLVIVYINDQVITLHIVYHVLNYYYRCYYYYRYYYYLHYQKKLVMKRMVLKY